MNNSEIVYLIQQIVVSAKRLKDQYTDEKKASVNYVAIFCQSDEEFVNYCFVLDTLGTVVKETKTGPLYFVDTPIQTIAGPLSIIKVRRHDQARPERGDADFTVQNYAQFKGVHAHLPEFTVIHRHDFEMLELKDPRYDVLAYFSHPTQEQLLKRM